MYVACLPLKALPATVFWRYLCATGPEGTSKGEYCVFVLVW